MTKLRVAAIQMDCVLAEKDVNLSHALARMDAIAGQADIVSFPEFFTTGYHLDELADDIFDLAETIPGPTTEKLAGKARQLGMAVVANILEKDDTLEGVLYDTSFVIDERGMYLGRYRKVHLYPDEHRFMRAGNEIPIFEIKGVKIGHAICYDHAFEELFRLLALKGAQLVFVPSAVPLGYEYLLNLRTRARAQDNQYFVVANNRVGTDGGVTYCGASKVVDPRGDVLAEAGTDEETIVATIDTAAILRERKQEPVLRSRRADLYGPLTADRAR